MTTALITLVSVVAVQAVVIVLLAFRLVGRSERELDLFDAAFRGAIAKNTSEFRSISAPKPVLRTNDLVEEIVSKVRDAEPSSSRPRQPVGFDGT